MKIAILSRGPDLYSTRRIREACTKRGHPVRILNPLSFSLDLEQGRPALFYKEKPLDRYDAVIPRIGASVTAYGTAVVRQFEQMGVFCLASSQAIGASRDKLRSCQVLSRHRIGMPKTVVVRRPDGVLPAIMRMGGPPIVIKLHEGTQGIGVILADSTAIAQAIVETLQGPGGKNVLLQQFVSESRGRDIRAFVVGGRVVAAMRRVAKGDEFRSNVHRGGRVEAVELDGEYQRTAVQAAQILGLRVAGVDMLEGKDGPLVTEVNASPGLEGIERATSVDVADAIVAHVEDEVQFPEIDLRQRLTLKTGYGVIEIPVEEGSTLANQRLSDARLRDRDIVVLSLQRGDISVPNPKDDRLVRPGDVLLCFGSIVALKALVPRPKKKRKKSEVESLPRDERSSSAARRESKPPPKARARDSRGGSVKGTAPRDAKRRRSGESLPGARGVR
ncbi:MAG TPA: RimK family alpha-L-glutamate ligase [Polyangiaceae bacterium]|nr:RimK family alpha-L-glutamate ligase [Polyangiaceae bacterium]